MDILGIRIDNLNMNEALDKALLAIENKDSFKYLFTPNAEICMSALKNSQLMEALNSSFLNIPDGEGVVLASKILKTPLKEKVAGCELVQNILNSQKTFSLYLLGASQESVEKAVEEIQIKYPQVKICGYRNGFFSSSDYEDIFADLNLKNPDLIIIGLGAPKQELFIYENRDMFPKSLAIGAGGTIDIISGYAKRAPEFFCKYKLEWFYRLLRQPKRFIRMLNIPVFLLKAFFNSFNIKRKT